MEREKAKKEAEAKLKAEAEAKANHKSKSQRIEERRTQNMRRRQEEDDEESSEEDEATKRERLRKTEKEADLKHAEDLFGDLTVAKSRPSAKAVTILDPSDSGKTIDLSSLPIFNPQTKDQFTTLRDTLAPLLAANTNKAHYVLFLQEFVKQIAKDLPSDHIKKVASGLTTLSNEKMKEEKAAEKGGKKTKAAKTKATLSANRDLVSRADTTSYDDNLDEYALHLPCCRKLLTGSQG